jgi:sulfite reductase (NADPH) flavoprotein alpha-component
VTDFIGLHPGGRTVLLNYSGLDATQGFMKAHQGHSEIEAMRDMYEIGFIRPLDFKGVSRSVLLAGGMSSVVGLAALYRKWTGTLYLVVEMENALLIDQSLQQSLTTQGESLEERSNYRLQRAIETHQRFLSCYANDLGGRILMDVWDLTSGMTGAEPSWMKNVMSAIHGGRDAGSPLALVAILNAKLKELIDGAVEERPELSGICRRTEAMDLKLLQSVKQCLKRGVMIFEKYQSSTLDDGAHELLGELRLVPTAFENYYQNAQRLVDSDSWRREDGPAALELWKPDEIVILSTDRYWTLEEHPEDRIVVLRRTPIPVETIEDLVSSNDRIIAMMEPRFLNYGIIVDSREAPQRNDSPFEDAMLQLRLVLSTSFARVAVLLESSTGVLQVNRIGRNDGADTFATMNEFAAVKFAKGPLPITDAYESNPPPH